MQRALLHDGLDRTRCPKLPELCRADADPDLKFPLGLFSLTSEAEGSSFPSEAVPDINLPLLPPCATHPSLYPFSVHVGLDTGPKLPPVLPDQVGWGLLDPGHS